MRTALEKKLLKIALILPATIIAVGLMLALTTAPVTQKNKATPSTLLQDKVLGLETPSLMIKPTEPNYYIANYLIIPQSKYSKPEIKVSAYNASASGTLRVYEASKTDIHQFVKVDEKENQMVTNLIDASRRQLILEQKVEIQKPENDIPPVVLPFENQSGIWLLELQYKEFKKQALLIRSGYGVFIANKQDELILWAQDFKTGKSVSNVKIEMYDLKNSQIIKNVGQTDEKGILETEIDKQMDIVIADRNGDIAFVTLKNLSIPDWWGFQKTKPLTNYFTFTDRPLYKPGDTIYFKSIIREDIDKKYTIKNKNVHVEIYHISSGQTLYKKTHTVTSRGSIQGEVTLPKDARAGLYEIRMIAEEEDLLYNTHSTYFRVEYYRKPEYSISVTVPDMELIRQDTMRAKIKATYFAGIPVRNKEVEYSITGCKYFEYQYTVFKQSNIDWYVWRGGCDYKIKKGKILLDNKGEATLAINTDLQPNTGEPLIWNIQVTLNDGSGNLARDSANLLVRQGQWGIYKNTYIYNAKVNTKQTIPIEIKYYQDTNINAIRLQQYISLTQWEKYIDPKQKYPQFKEKTKEIETREIIIEDGKNASITFTPREEGQYKITLEGTDAKENRIIKNIFLYVSAQDWIYDPPHKYTVKMPISITTDKTEFMPNEKVKTYINLEEEIKERDVLITIEGQFIDRYQVVSIPNNTTTIDIELKVSDIPNRYITARTFTNTTLVMDKKNIGVGKNTKKLDIKIIPEKTETAPGQTIAVNIQTKDNKGNPISTNIALWGIDQAIFELARSELKDIYEHFWSERYVGSKTENSLTGLGEYVGLGGGGGCFTGDTKISMADGKTKKMKDIKKGDKIKTRVSEKDPSLVETEVTNVFEHVVQGYLIINGNIKITPEHILYVNNQWKPAGYIQIGDELTSIDNKKMIVASIEWINAKEKVYNLEIAKYHTFFANEIWVHNEKGGEVVREMFKDTLYWNPSIQTNKNGQATVYIALPDNLTTWILTAVGDTHDTKVGQTYAEVKTTKEIIVRPIVPNIVRINDKINLSAMVYNGTEKEHTFNVILQYPAAKITNPKQTITIKPKETKQLYFEAEIIKEDQSGLMISAINVKDKNMGDTVKIPLPVRPFHVIIQKGESATNNHTYVIETFPDTDKAKTEVTLTLASNLTQNMKSAIQYLIHYPYGCTEQTMSSLVPIIIAKKYEGVFKEELNNQRVNKMVNIEKILEKGFHRLMQNQKGEGGWSWWGAGQSDIFVTTYVIEYLELARQTGIAFDPIMLEKAKAFITRHRGGTEIEKIYKAYAKSLWDKNIPQIQPETLEKLPSEALVYAVLVNQRLGNKNPQTNGINLLLNKAKEQGDALFWSVNDNIHFNSDLSTTALAIRALNNQGEYQKERDKALKYIARNKIYEYWGNSFATAQILRMIAEVEEKIPENNYTYTVKLDGKEIAKGKVNQANNNPPTINIPSEKIKAKSEIKIEKAGTGTLYSTLLFKQARTKTNLPAQNNGLTIKRSFISEKGENYSFGVGDKVKVVLKISGLKGEENYAVVQDELPAGLVPINKNFNNENEQGSYFDMYYTASNYDSEYTENGIIMRLYKLYPEHTVSYDARVISEGTFNVPPAFVSLMYAPGINATSQTQTITTEKEAREVRQMPHQIQKEEQNNNQKQKSIISLPTYMAYAGILILALWAVYVLEKHRKTKSNQKQKTDEKGEKQ